MTEPWWTLARWGIVVAWTTLVVFVGDPVVQRVFHFAGSKAALPAADEDRAGEIESVGASGPGTTDLAAELEAPEGSPVGPTGDDAVELADPDDSAMSPVEEAAKLLRGGRVIGWLERLGTVATLLAGFPAGIAAIVAIKGLARYPDLKASDGTAERFILGTFTSLLLGAAGAGAAHWCLGLLPPLL